MTDQIVKVVDVELLPPSELPGLPEVLAGLNSVVRTELPELAERARSWTMKSAQDCREAAPDLKRIREIGELGEDNLRPFLAKVNKVREFLLGAINTQRVLAKPHADLLAGKIAEFDRLEKLAARQEEDRINAENRRRAQEAADEQKRQAEKDAKERKEKRIKELDGMLRRKEISRTAYAKLLREAGATEEADREMAAVQAEERAAAVPVVKVQPNRVTVGTGLRATVQYNYAIIDIEKIPRALLYPNRAKDGTWDPKDFPRLSEMVRKTKNIAVAEGEGGGGIRVFEVNKV